MRFGCFLYGPTKMFSSQIRKKLKRRKLRTKNSRLWTIITLLQLLHDFFFFLALFLSFLFLWIFLFLLPCVFSFFFIFFILWFLSFFWHFLFSFVFCFLVFLGLYTPFFKCLIFFSFVFGSKFIQIIFFILSFFFSNKQYKRKLKYFMFFYFFIPQPNKALKYELEWRLM